MLSDGRSMSAPAFTKSITASKFPFCMALQRGVRNVFGSNIFGSAFIISKWVICHAAQKSKNKINPQLYPIIKFIHEHPINLI